MEGWLLMNRYREHSDDAFTQGEQIAELRAFAQASLTFHQSCAAILEALNESLADIASSVPSQPKRVYKKPAAGLQGIKYCFY